jgi:hypothetical protein
MPTVPSEADFLLQRCKTGAQLVALMKVLAMQRSHAWTAVDGLMFSVLC